MSIDLEGKVSGSNVKDRTYSSAKPGILRRAITSCNESNAHVADLVRALEPTPSSTLGGVGTFVREATPSSTLGGVGAFVREATPSSGVGTFVREATPSSTLGGVGAFVRLNRCLPI